MKVINVPKHSKPIQELRKAAQRSKALVATPKAMGMGADQRLLEACRTLGTVNAEALTLIAKIVLPIGRGKYHQASEKLRVLLVESRRQAAAIRSMHAVTLHAEHARQAALMSSMSLETDEPPFLLPRPGPSTRPTSLCREA